MKSHNMNKFTFYYFIFILNILNSCSFISKTQKNIDPERDTINITEFDLCQKDMDFSSVNTIQYNEFNFLSKFVNPLRISKDYWEVLDDSTNLYLYNGAEVNFYKDKIESLELNNANYKFILANGISIKVGDNISVVRKLFPKSWDWMKFQTLDNFVFIDLIGPKGPIDAILSFEFDNKTKMIKSIQYAVNNS